MKKIVRRQGRVYLYFVSPTGQVLKRIDISNWSIQEVINKLV